jgi:hypothetical protein
MTTKQRSKTERQRHIREDANGHRRFILHPEDNDTFVRTGRQVVEGCRLGISVEVWLDECKAMFERVREWAQARAERVQACYAAPETSGIKFFFVPFSETYDIALDEELTDLDVELFRRFNVGTVDVLEIPARSLDRFLPPEATVLIYGDAARPPQSVEP